MSGGMADGQLEVGKSLKHYYPKSQTLHFGAVFIWGLCVLAIRQNMGLDLESGGLPLVGLLGLGVVCYLKSGKRIDVDTATGEVRRVWRLVGVPLWSSREWIVAEGVELRPEWMRWLKVQDESVKGLQKGLVYDLVLVGYEDSAEEPHRDLVVELKVDQMLFTLAERRARAVAEELNLPVSVRWDRLYEEIPCETREAGEWRRHFAYPQEMHDWRKWLPW